MTLSPKKSALEALLHDIKQVETRLDAATRSVEEFPKAHPDASAKDESTLAEYIKNEKIQAQKWTKSFDAIINHQPCNFEDLKYKTLALLEYADTGHDNPNILKTISRDLRAFSSDDSKNTTIIKPTFLLIGDSKIDRSLIRKALAQQRADLNFIELEDTLTVLEVIKLQKPCVTLLDVSATNTDGNDLLKLIREDKDLKNHPVWMLSTSEDDRDIETALETGANGYLPKPSSISEYSKLAETILEDA